MKTFQVNASGKPIFYFEVNAEFVDDAPSERNTELANNIAEVLEVEGHGPAFAPQLITKLPLVFADRAPDHSQDGLHAWVSPKLRR